MVDELAGHGLAVEAQAQGTTAQTEVRRLAEGWWEITLSLAAGKVSVVQAQLTVTLPAELLASESRVLVCGESRGAGRGAVSLRELRGENESAVVEAMAVAIQSNTRTLLVGLAGYAPDFPQITLGTGSITVSFAPRRALPEALELSVVVGMGDDAHALLERYGDLLGRGARALAPPPTGWNSWDYYQAAVTMDELRGELTAINASPLAGKLRVFCIDMGWETAWGDWRPNRNFPEMAQVATEIRAAGMEPGIWLSPLQMRPTLPVLRHRRDMLCHDENGQVILSGGHVMLDPTHPWTREWLFDLCRGLREAGFSFFKIDYLYRDYLEKMGPLQVPTGKAAAARLFLEIIREAIGDQAHLLSCGAPLPAALGLADSARIGTDIHNFWGHVRNCAVQIAMSYWQNGRLWVNDPDFALIRCRETTDDPYLNVPFTPRPFDSANPENFWMAGTDATLPELKTWLALVHLCGGSVFASDSIARLNALGLGLLQRLVAEPCAPARPLDLFAATPPRVWLAEGRLGVFNFADEVADVPLSEGLPATGEDFWTGARVELGESLRLLPHEALLVKI